MEDTLQREVDKFLARGEYDVLFRNWPGAHFLMRDDYATECLRDALEDVVQSRSSNVPPLNVEQHVPRDIVSFSRAKVEPMVRGLFRRDECDAVLELLQESVVFILPESIESLIRCEDLHTAWTIANMYLEAIGAEQTGQDAPNIVGMSVETTCYVAPQYFTETAPFADYVVHEAAHIFHNVKRATIGLRSTRYRQWLLPIEFRKRETFAYACEVYSRILERSKGPRDRERQLTEAKETFRPPSDHVDDDEFFTILGDAVARRNGWKAILEACSAKPVRRRS